MLRLIGFLALLAYVLAAVSDAGFVCFGSDGHVGLEQLRPEHPLVIDSTAISVPRAQVVALVARDTPRAMPHGPCFDVALDPSSQWQAGAKTEAPRVSAPPLVPVGAAPAVLAPPADVPHCPVAFAEPTSDPVLTPLRSTVLRI